jgi:D-sedoheptulose 7-phosphate isomerase
MINYVEQMFNQTKRIDEFCKSYFDYLHQLLYKLDFRMIEKVAAELEAARMNGNTIFVVGNGGSAVTATHLANDFGTDILKKSGTEIPFNVHALTDNTAVMMAVANDDGYDRIFVNQLRVHYRAGDRLLAISASGNSPNVVVAAEWVRAKGGVVMSFVGFNGGKLKEISDITIHVESNPGEYGPVEDIHLVLNHILANWLQYKVMGEVEAGRSK